MYSRGMNKGIDMNQEKAIRECVKTQVAFKMLQNGIIGRMSKEQFKEFMEWLG
jgi:hypothetical protein